MTFLSNKHMVTKTKPMIPSPTGRLILESIKRKLLVKQITDPKIRQRILGAETYEQLLWGVLGNQELEDECKSQNVALTREYDKLAEISRFNQKMLQVKMSHFT